MSTHPGDQLLEAAIQHLEDLKARGTRFVSISPGGLQSLAALRDPPPSALRPAPGTAPTSVSIPRPAAAPPSPAPARAATPLRPVAPVPSGAPTPPQRPPLPGPALPARPAAAPTPARAPLAPDAKAAALAELRTRALACVKCPHLVAARRQVVFGVGSVNADLMFVGEAPGMDEDKQGEPFVGRAGQLLTRIIQTMGLTRETVYIGNILKCRPDTPGQSFGNRQPTPEEMETCIPYLLEQIEIIRPKVLVALGATAVKGLLGECQSITRMRGQWQTFQGCPLMPTFHPSFLLRPENADKKRLIWQDMLAVMERLEMPISEKQRGYFSQPGA